MEYDEDAKAFVTYVKELHGMSTFGETESLALENTAEMICGYIQSMVANQKRIPLARLMNPPEPPPSSASELSDCTRNS